MRLQIWLILLIVAFTLPGLFLLGVTGTAPSECRYLVPVTEHPGVLKCSGSPNKAKR